VTRQMHNKHAQTGRNFSNVHDTSLQWLHIREAAACSPNVIFL
jgi:hypothetical protein